MVVERYFEQQIFPQDFCIFLFVRNFEHAYVSRGGGVLITVKSKDFFKLIFARYCNVSILLVLELGQTVFNVCVL